MYSPVRMGRYVWIAALTLLACRERGRSVGLAEPEVDAGRGLVVPTSPVPNVGACAAITPCIKNCDLGDSDACVRAGNFRWRGHRSEGEARTELDFFRTACDAGNADGCRYLAFKYEGGEGVDADPTRARDLLHKAAAIYAAACGAKRAGACASLASMTENGEGMAPDPKKGAALRDTAAALHRSACALGSAECCSELGYLYRFGDGVAEDRERAADLYQRACELGLAEMCSTLGDFHRHRTDPLSAAMYQRGCEMGDAEGCAKLGDLLSEGGMDVARDPASAVRLYERGCDLGDWKTSCAGAAEVYASGHEVQQDYARASLLLEKACTGGNTEACLAIALLSESGRGVIADEAMAAEYERRACEGGAKEACEKTALQKGCDQGKAEDCGGLGRVYGTAHAGVTDIPRAVELYAKACDAGYTQGCEDGRTIASVLRVVQDECDKGSATSCYQVGLTYERAPRPERDIAEQAFTRACTMGLTDACGRKERLSPLP